MNSAALYGVLGYIIHNAKHLNFFESAQRGAASMILKTMKSTPTDGPESELSIFLIDLDLEELQQHLIWQEGTRHIKWGILLKT